MKISQRAFDLIVAEEVSSKAYYERHYTHPEWPGGGSGVTIGIGYDLGMASRAKITADWSGRVSQNMLLVMLRCAGVHGDAARKLLPEVKPAIVIPWDIALDVFSNRDIPQWTATVIKALSNTDKLTPTCLGVIVSIVYNRGASFSMTGDRYTEMRSIKAHMVMMMISAIPADIRSMKRLWPTVKGLRDRRDREAAMFQSGLTAVDPEANIVKPTPTKVDPEFQPTAGPARTKPPATSTAQNSTTGAIIIAGGTAAQQAHALGYSGATVALIVALGIAIASAVFITWYRNRNPS